MKIHAISDAPKPPKIDLELFSQELQELSARHDLKLISLGDMTMFGTASKGGAYLAMWATNDSQARGE